MKFFNRLFSAGFFRLLVLGGLALLSAGCDFGGSSSPQAGDPGTAGTPSAPGDPGTGGTPATPAPLNVAVAGYERVDGTTFFAKSWINGAATFLPGGADARAVAVSRADLYVAGYHALAAKRM
jgi:hypothetical protein